MQVPSNPARHAKVALVIETSRSYGRDVLRGIARYARTQTQWSLLHQEMTIDSQPPTWWSSVRVDGIIARVSTKNIDSLRRFQVPIVDVRCAHTWEDIPQVETDEDAVVRMAFDHLYDRGHRQFAFCGFQFAHYSEARKQRFLSLANGTGCPCSIYESPAEPDASLMQIEQIQELDNGRLVYWLKGLKAPTGLFVCNDICGQQVLNVCRMLEIDVPDDLAVIGVDNDDAICPLCDPPLSSVYPNAEEIGFRAAAKLHSMMQGISVSRVKEYVPPLRVEQRLSTQSAAIQDREVARACRFIRQHACEGIDVLAVSEYSRLSRRQLERRFRDSLGRSPKEEITATQIAKVQQLLRETQMTLESIAPVTGYSHPQRLCSVFKRETGMTPTQYRARLPDDSKQP